MLIPSTRVEDEKFGETATEVKDRVKDTAQEAMEHGKQVAQEVAQNATETLLDKFRTDSLSEKRAGILPIRVSFPAFGPSLFLVSELTGENQAPSAVFNFQRDKKAGGK